MIATLALFLALQQSTNCEDDYYQQTDKPGKQPDTKITEDCGGSSVQIHVEIEAGGTIKVLEAATTASIQVTIKAPSECISEIIEYSGEVNQCGVPKGGWNCDPTARVVQVRKLEADPACPTVPADLADFLGGFVSAIQVGFPVSLPCNKLKDATAEIDANSRTRYSARISKCAGATELSTQVSATESRPADLLYLEHEGDPLAIDFEALIPAGVQAIGSRTIEGGAELHELVHDGSSALLPPALAAAHAAHPPLSWFDDLSVLVTSTYPLHQPDGSILLGSFVRQYVADVRAGGDFFLQIPDVLTAPDGQSFPFLDEWACRSGNLYQAESQSEVGMAYPARTGAAAAVFGGELQYLPWIRGWLENPFRVLFSSSADYQATDLGSSRTQVDFELDWDYADGVSSEALVDLLLGTSFRLIVDESGSVPRVESLEQFVAGAQLQYRIEFQDYAMVSESAWRPMRLEIDEYDPSGVLDRQTTLVFSGFASESDVPTALTLPTPELDLWYVPLF